MSSSLDLNQLSNSLLCSVCQNLLLLKELYLPQYHHLSREALAEAATNGCPLCVWIWDAFSPLCQELRPLRDEEDWRFVVYLDHRHGYNVMGYQFRIGGRKPHSSEEFFPLSGYNDVLRANILLLPINGYSTLVAQLNKV